ncbi:hypothetical protein [Branchiibius cervicis]|uniref:Uncharacterized protein n=1 Tax=Branchiibius cervicis TaxID=908252 RepID=A0ABW2ATH1_9MICO
MRVTGAYTGTEGRYSATTLEEAAYVINKYGNPSKSLPLATRARMVTAVDALNGYLAGNSKEHMLTASPGKPSAGVAPTTQVSDYANVKALFDKYLAEAQKYHGAQTMVVKGAAGGKVGATGTVTFGAKAKASGQYVPGESYTATLTGGAKFADGTTTKKGLTGTALTSLQVKYTSTAKATLSVSTVTPDYGLWITKSSKWQNLWVAGTQSAPIKASAVWSASANITKFTPKLTTAVSVANGKVGQSLTDTIKGSGFPAGVKVTGTDDLYYVPYGTKITQGAIPSNATKVTTLNWSGTTDSKGNLTVITSAYKPTKAGTYVFVEHSAAGSSSTSSWSAYNGQFGEPTESSTFTKPEVPTIATQVQAGQDISKPLSDTVIGSGLPAGAKVAGTDELYYLPYGTKVTESDTVPANAVKVGTYDWSATADEDGDLQAKTAPVTVTKPGVYVYVETANAGSAGGSTWNKITGKFGDTDETVSLTSPTSPVVTTQIQAGGDVAKPISDTINGSGFPAGASVTGTDDLYFVPYGTKVVEGTVPANAEKITTYTWSATADGSGKVTATTPNYTPTKAGTYVFVESANAGNHGGYTWGKITGKFGSKTESASLTKPGAPSVITHIQTGQDISKPIHDQINGSGFPAGASVKGNDDLYYLPYGTKLSPSDAVPSNAVKLGSFSWSGTADAAGNVSATTPSYTVTKPGLYVYRESVLPGSGEGGTWGPIISKFGQHTESASLVKNVIPKVTTKVSNTTVKQGDALSDTVMGSGFPAGASVQGDDDLYYLPKGVAVTTDGSIPKGAVKVGSFTWSGKADAKGNLSTTTAKYTVNKTDGTYVYVESAKSGNYQGHVWPAVKGKFGQKAETSNIKTPKPPVVPTGDAEMFGVDTGALAVGGLITVVGASGLIGAFRLRRKATQEN